MNEIISGDGAFINREQYYPRQKPQAQEPVTKHSFSDFFKVQLAALCAEKGSKITKKDIAEELGISYELFRKIVNREKPAASRDLILAVCALLHADTHDTNRALHFNDGMRPLDDFEPRDELLMNLLDDQQQTPRSIQEIDQILTANGFAPLRIIQHKNTDHPRKPHYPFRLIRKQFQCTVRGVGRYREPDSFLSLLYDPVYFYATRTCMEFEDGGRRYEICLCAREQRADDLFRSFIRSRIEPPQKQYIVYADPDETHSAELHTYHTPDETGIFREAFLEMEKTEKEEQKKLWDILHDTRNYGSRISARVIDSEIHVFCEEYNCDVPEFSEYYLMDHCGGTETLYIVRNSCFMQMYLPAEQYEKLYRKPCGMYRYHIRQQDDAWFSSSGDPVTEIFTSEEDVELSAFEARDVGIYESYNENTMTALRLHAYRKLQAKIRGMIEKLKTGSAHICNAAVFADDSDAMLLDYFHVREICPALLHTPDAALTLADGRQITLSRGDLLDGFALGLQSIEETGQFLLRHGSLKLSELL